jgi:hypothetical protein
MRGELVLGPRRLARRCAERGLHLAPKSIERTILGSAEKAFALTEGGRLVNVEGKRKAGEQARIHWIEFCEDGFGVKIERTVRTAFQFRHDHNF